MNKKNLMFYLPYGVRVVPAPNYKESLRVTCLKEETYLALYDWPKQGLVEIPYDCKDYKMALYPLSALSVRKRIDNKEISPLEFIYCSVFQEIHGLQSGSMFGWFEEALLTYFAAGGSCSFSKDLMNRIYYILYTLHFDLTNSIRKREAKDILKLGFDPYCTDPVILP